jgi:nucleotide-binding universal stress UspA family protein
MNATLEQQILVPLDGSALAEAVLPHAEALARITARGLLLLHVVTPAETGQTRLWSTAAPADLRLQWEEADLTRIHTYMASVAARLQTEGLQVRTEVLTDHDPASAIIDRAAGDPAIALIAMATHGRSGLSRWVLGSVAAKLLPAAPKPLLLLRMREDAVVYVAESRYRRLVVPLDGSASAEVALEQAQMIAAACDATLIPVVVVPPLEDAGLVEAGVIPYWMQAERQEQHQHAKLYLRQLTARLTGEGLRVRSKVATGQPAEAILRTSTEEQADMIVMATHGQRGKARRWLGSVVTKVAQGAEVPLLLVDPEPDPPKRPHPRVVPDG